MLRTEEILGWLGRAGLSPLKLLPYQLQALVDGDRPVVLILMRVHLTEPFARAHSSRLLGGCLALSGETQALSLQRLFF